MELCLLSLLILIDCNSYPCVLFEGLSHVINQKSHVYSWNLGRMYLFIFWNFGISWVKQGRFQNFKKVNSVNLSQISLLNMWLLVRIGLTFQTKNIFKSSNSLFWCMSDILIGVVAQLLYTLETYDANCLFATLFLFVSVFLTHVSGYLIAIIGIDRYIRVKYFL